MKLTFRQCVMDDLPVLCEFSRRTFREAYAHMNSPSNMETYLEKAFHADKLRGELSNPNSRFFFLFADDELAGYLKLNESPGQTDINDAASLEIERVYVAKEFQNQGLGSILIDKAAEIANRKKKTYLWLGVWEINDGAVRFYMRNEFHKAGRHFFVVGDEKQADFIMRRDLKTV